MVRSDPRQRRHFMFGPKAATAFSCLYLSRAVTNGKVGDFAYPRVTRSYNRRAEPGNINVLGLSLLINSVLI